MATPFEFDLPLGFGPIPLDPDVEERAEHARRLLTHLPADQRENLDTQVQGLVAGGELMLRSGARVAGQLTVPDADPSVSATFTLAIRDLPNDGAPLGEQGSHRAFMAAIGDELRTRHPDSDIRGVDLTCGPGLVAVRAGSYRFPAERTRSGEPEEAPSYGMQVILPDPDGDRLVVLDTTTSGTERWPEFVEQTFAVANSISFETGTEAE